MDARDHFWTSEMRHPVGDALTFLALKRFHDGGEVCRPWLQIDILWVVTLFYDGGEICRLRQMQPWVVVACMSRGRSLGFGVMAVV
jgi:hypothetical protein